MANIGSKVKVSIGRNKGEIGIAKRIEGDNVYVDFNRSINVNEGFGSVSMYPDGYWVNVKYVEVI